MACAYGATAETYDLIGSVAPKGRARVSIQSSGTPFGKAVLVDLAGKFKVRKLPQGTYTVAAFTRTRGEARQTIEVGPGTADNRKRVHIELRLKETEATREALRRRNTVTTSQLKIPEKATREYMAAQARLTKRDSDGALKHLEKATASAPQFAVAWNLMGTIYYQTRRFTLAEEKFRSALQADPQLFEAIVNLGGVAVTLRKYDVALEYNVRAVTMHPQDALANSQLGMTYFSLGKFDLAGKYLETARKLDPAHFSLPQLLLAEIHLRQKRPELAAKDLEDFLERHPDSPDAPAVRTALDRLRRNTID